MESRSLPGSLLFSKVERTLKHSEYVNRPSHIFEWLRSPPKTGSGGHHSESLFFVIKILNKNYDLLLICCFCAPSEFSSLFFFNYLSFFKFYFKTNTTLQTLHCTIYIRLLTLLYLQCSSLASNNTALCHKLLTKPSCIA